MPAGLRKRERDEREREREREREGADRRAIKQSLCIDAAAAATGGGRRRRRRRTRSLARSFNASLLGGPAGLHSDEDEDDDDDDEIGSFNERRTNRSQFS